MSEVEAPNATTVGPDTPIDPAIRGLIFDCDGTLTDSMPVHYLAWKQAFERSGIEFTEQRFYSMAGMPTDRIVATLGAEAGLELDPQVIGRQKEANFFALLQHVQPVERVVAVARAEKGRRRIAVASGGYRDSITRQLEHIGLGDWFDAVVTAEDTERHKPHPDVFLEAARRLGVPANQCLVYEDADLGVEAARRAGMQCIDVRRGPWGSSSA